MPFTRPHLKQLCHTDCAEIVVYEFWEAKTSLGADWDRMGVAWVVRDSVWNVTFACRQRRQELVELGVHHTLQTESIDLVFAYSLACSACCCLPQHMNTFALILTPYVTSHT